ncbi:MAG: TetR/AcrR family transcriptional regulator C-terminal domain-containing protein, partial [Octadecabacter sp.]
ADQFSELCKADLFPRLVFSMEKSFDDVQKLRIVTGAVDTFLARYAA